MKMIRQRLPIATTRWQSSRKSKGIESMTSKLALGIAAALIVPLSLGCSANSGVVRGQNPAPMAAPGVDRGQQMAYQSGGPHQVYPMSAAAEPMPQTQMVDGGYYCPPTTYGHHGLRQHRHWFTYDQPTDLRYPAANTPAPIVQYPYFTVKGPSDFFMK